MAALPSALSTARDRIRPLLDGLRRDNVPVAAAGIAFWAFLALVPALLAVVSIYGLVADAADVEADIENRLSSLPDDVRSVVGSQLTDIAGSSGAGLGIGLAFGLAAALWSASGAVKHLLATINAVHDCTEDRGFLKLRGLALGLTVGAIVFVAVAGAVLAVVPAWLGGTGLGGPVRVLLNGARFPALAVSLVAALVVLYRLAPNRPAPPWRSLLPGAVVGTAVWITLSGLFSIYTAGFASYNETYGALGAIVVLLMWLYLTGFAVLLGAEFNAVREQHGGDWPENYDPETDQQAP